MNATTAAQLDCHLGFTSGLSSDLSQRHEDTHPVMKNKRCCAVVVDLGAVFIVLLCRVSPLLPFYVPS